MAKSNKSTMPEVASAVIRMESMMFLFSVAFNGDAYQDKEKAKAEIAKMALRIQKIMVENHVGNFEAHIMPRL